MGIIETYKDALELELAQLTKDLNELGIQNPDNPEDWISTPEAAIKTEPDENVAADRNEAWQERRSTLVTLETRFRNITHALQKIETGTYGTCEIGGDTIEADRLSVNPAARTCKKHIDNESDLPE